MLPATIIIVAILLVAAVWYWASRSRSASSGRSDVLRDQPASSKDESSTTVPEAAPVAPSPRPDTAPVSETRASEHATPDRAPQHTLPVERNRPLDRGETSRVGGGPDSNVETTAHHGSSTTTSPVVVNESPVPASGVEDGATVLPAVVPSSEESADRDVDVNSNCSAPEMTFQVAPEDPEDDPAQGGDSSNTKPELQPTPDIAQSNVDGPKPPAEESCHDWHTPEQRDHAASNANSCDESTDPTDMESNATASLAEIINPSTQEDNSAQGGGSSETTPDSTVQAAPEVVQPTVNRADPSKKSLSGDEGQEPEPSASTASNSTASDVETDPVREQPIPQANRQTVPPVDRDDKTEHGNGEERATTNRTATKYQPAARTAKATRRRRRTAPVQRTNPDRKTDRRKSLSMSVHVSFGRRNRCRVSLLPSRTSELPESLDVKGPDGVETWDALQDEWFNDVMPADLGTALKKGRVWELAELTEDTAWSFSGRDICVLAQGSTISGYVSVPRLILGEDHLVLCTKQSLETVQIALSAAGCSTSDPFSGDGIPSGWLLLVGVRPTVAVAHEIDAGILNILRPIHDVEITLRHGIRLSHSRWLRGHPPRINVRGQGDLNVDVLIDESPASLETSGGFTAPGWDSHGIHTVFCGGQTQTYEIVDGVNSWQPFQSFTYHPARKRAPNHEISICGPIVDTVGDSEIALLTPSTNSCLLGALPGQVLSSPAPYDSFCREYLALADFPVVWTVPSNALRSDRSKACINLVQFEEVENGRDVPTGTSHEDVLRWCRAILDASRKRLPLTPNSDAVLEQWLQYRKVARQLWRKLR